MNFIKQPIKSTYFNNRYNSLLLLGALFFTIAALWFPFGFALTALIEEWGLLGLFVKHGVFFLSSPSSPLAPHALRPLTFFPHALAYVLDTNSFIYLHILMMLALLVKGFSFAYLIRKMTNSAYWSLLAGVLVILYPADTMQIAFRGLHINWSLSLVLLAGSFFIAAIQTQRLGIYVLLSILAGALMFTSICMYDVALALFCLPFLILYGMSGFKKGLRELYARKLAVFCWLGAFLLYLLYAYYISTKVTSYEGSVRGEQSILYLLSLYYPKLFTIGALRGLLGGWFDAFRILFSEYALSGYVYIAFVTLIFYALFLLTKPFSINTRTIIGRGFWRVPVTGLLLLLAGYLPFALLLTHSAISQRTFLFASPGAVIIWISFLMLIEKWTKKIAFLLAFILIFAGFAAQLFHYHHYIGIATTQRSLLKNIVANYEGNPDKTLVIIDKSNQLNHTWMFILSNLSNALTYIYDHPIKSVQVCHAPGQGWQLLDTIARPGTCTEHVDNWSFRYPKVISINGKPSPHPPELVLNKNEVFTLIINPDGSVNPDSKLNNYRKKLLSSKNNLGARYRNILADNNWPSYFNKFWQPQPTNSYHWQFGKWWSLEMPIRGNGWREAEWQVNSFFHQSSAWKAQKEADLQFDLIPKGQEYKLHLYLNSILNDAIRASIKIRINDYEIAYRWVNHDEIEATLPTKDLIKGVNTLTFDSKTDEQTYDLSFRLVSVDLFPIKGTDNSLSRNA